MVIDAIIFTKLMTMTIIGDKLQDRIVDSIEDNATITKNSAMNSSKGLATLIRVIVARAIGSA